MEIFELQQIISSKPCRHKFLLDESNSCYHHLGRFFRPESFVFLCLLGTYFLTQSLLCLINFSLCSINLLGYYKCKGCKFYFIFRTQQEDKRHEEQHDVKRPENLFQQKLNVYVYVSVPLFYLVLPRGLYKNI